jgi:hypothetical protein
MQRTPEAVPAPKPIGAFIEMGDPDASRYIVRDINDQSEGTGWRWVHEFPEMRFILNRTRGWKFAMDIGLPAFNFQQTGPVTISLYVNGKLLDRVRYTTPGDHRYEKPVPASWLKTGEFTLVRAQVSPPWIAPTDKARLGFVLYRAGFVE